MQASGSYANCRRGWLSGFLKKFFKFSCTVAASVPAVVRAASLLDVFVGCLCRLPLTVAFGGAVLWW